MYKRQVDLYEAKDVTVQYSTIVESATSGHPEGVHNYGLINGPDGHRISLHRNLFAHHKNRAPAIANGPAEVTNNVIYNVRHGFVHHNPASGQFNIVGNVYIQGPNDTLYPFWFDDETPGSDPTMGYHLADNYIDDPGDYVGVVNDPWAQPLLHPSFSDMFASAAHYAPSAYDFTASVPGHHPVTIDPSSQTLADVLAEAGAFPRDVVTTRVVGELVDVLLDGRVPRRHHGRVVVAVGRVQSVCGLPAIGDAVIVGVDGWSPRRQACHQARGRDDTP